MMGPLVVVVEGGVGGYGMRIGRRSRNHLIVSLLQVYVDECNDVWIL
jgi:hypothetical protein